MPFKDVKEKRKWRKNWNKLNPESTEKILARRLASMEYPNSEMCAVNRCGKLGTDRHHLDYAKPLEIIWLCELHHHVFHENFKLRNAKKCSVEGCDNKHHGKGYCLDHYSKWYKSQIKNKPDAILTTMEAIKNGELYLNPKYISNEDNPIKTKGKVWTPAKCEGAFRCPNLAERCLVTTEEPAQNPFTREMALCPGHQEQLKAKGGSVVLL